MLIQKFKKAGQSSYTEGFSPKLKLLINKLHGNYGYFYDEDFSKKFGTPENNKFLESELIKGIKQSSKLQSELNTFIYELMTDETEYKSDIFMGLLNPEVFEENDFKSDRLSLALFLILDNKRIRNCLESNETKLLNESFTTNDFKKFIKDTLVPFIVINF